MIASTASGWVERCAVGVLDAQQQRAAVMCLA
jgi:hypothetical protein